MPLTTTLAGGSALIKWLLRDEFSGTLAAGAVNGTLATPGPGTRVVTDTTNVLSVGSGFLNTGAGPAGWDPALWYGGLSRVAGRVMVGGFPTSTWAAGAYWTFGYDVNQAGSISEASWYLNNGNFTVQFAGVGPVSIFTSTPATDLDLIVVLRAAGGYAFAKIAGANWTLQYVGATGVGATVYPGISNFNDGAVACDYMRIPDELYLPTPLAYDTFTRANGALGSTEATGPDGQTAPVHAWNNRVGTTQIATNKASASALVGGIAIATVDTAASVDTIVQGTLTRAGNEVGVILRYVDADNYIRAIHDGTNCQLIKRVATAETTVITAAVAIGAGAIAVIPEGTSFSLYLNNAKVGATSTIADGALQTGTEQGLFSTNVGNTQDAFLTMPRGTNGEYSALDRYSS